MIIRRSKAHLLLAVLAACHHGGPPSRVASVELELVETFPVETQLDHADVRDAAAVWPEMIDRARRTIDLGELYASDAEPPGRLPSKLTPAIEALERATGRGVRLRFLADAKFATTYPATLERLRVAGGEVRIIDYGKLAGGVMHAKYFIVDGIESFVGSQNFDWRALEHIQEMGVRVRSETIAGQLEDVFETDWQLSAGGATSARVHAHPAGGVELAGGARLELVASPTGWLPDEAAWDLPRLAALVDGAARRVDVQVLTYEAHDRDGGPFLLDEALRRAAGRGVRVRLLVSHWGARPASRTRASIEALATVPGIEVRVLTIPPWSGGEIPFARVSHAKYAIFDGDKGWVGTSNWEPSYFTRTRNVGVIVTGGALPARLAGIFDDGWASPYAAPLPSR